MGNHYTADQINKIIFDQLFGDGNSSDYSKTEYKFDSGNIIEYNINDDVIVYIEYADLPCSWIGPEAKFVPTKMSIALMNEYGTVVWGQKAGPLLESNNRVVISYDIIPEITMAIDALYGFSPFYHLRDMEIPKVLIYEKVSENLTTKMLMRDRDVFINPNETSPELVRKTIFRNQRSVYSSSNWYSMKELERTDGKVSISIRRTTNKVGIVNSNLYSISYEFEKISPDEWYCSEYDIDIKGEITNSRNMLFTIDNEGMISTIDFLYSGLGSIINYSYSCLREYNSLCITKVIPERE